MNNVYTLEERISGDFRVWIQEKVLLGHKPSRGIYGNHRETHLKHPGVHDVMDSSRKFSAISLNSLWKQNNKKKMKQQSTVGWHVLEIFLI